MSENLLKEAQDEPDVMKARLLVKPRSCEISALKLRVKQVVKKRAIKELFALAIAAFFGAGVLANAQTVPFDEAIRNAAANIEHDTRFLPLTLQDDTGSNSPAISGFSTGQKVGAGFLNLAVGIGSFTMGDWTGGLTMAGGYAVAAGLIIWEVAGLQYEDALAGIPGPVGIGIAAATAIYGFIRPFIYRHDPLSGINMVIIPDRNGIKAVSLTYTYQF